MTILPRPFLRRSWSWAMVVSAVLQPALGGAAEQDHAASPVVLEWRFHEGESLYYLGTTAIEQRLRVEGDDDEARQSRQELREITRLVVDRVHGDGSVELRYVALFFGARGFGQLAEIEDRLPGLTLTVTLSPERKVTSVDGLDDFAARLAGDDENARAAVASALSEESLGQKLAQLFEALPRRSVEPGESWSRAAKLDLAMAATQTVHTDYRYVGSRTVDGRELQEVRLSARAKLDPGPAPAGAAFEILEGTVEVIEDESWMHFDPKLGRIARQQAVARFDIRFGGEMPGRGAITMMTEGRVVSDTRIAGDPLPPGAAPTGGAWDPERDGQRVVAFLDTGCSAGEAGSCLARYSMLLREASNDVTPEAVDWLRRAADLGDGEALLYMGRAHQEGRGVPRDLLRARRLYTRARDRGEPMAEWALESLEASEEESLAGQPERLAALLETSCDEGNARRCFARSAMFFHEDVVHPPDQAIARLRRAAELKNPEGLRLLALLHLRGVGVPRDEAQARRLYDDAAELDDFRASSELKRLDERVARLPADESFEALRAAATEGSVPARLQLARTYHMAGYPELAEEWYLRVVEQGHPSADHALGQLYSGWSELPGHEPAAMRHIRRAASAGLSDAQYALAERLMEGQGAEQDFGEAAVWLRRAAEQDDPEARIDLGYALYAGRGAERDVAAAMRWLRRPFGSRMWGYHLRRQGQYFAAGSLDRPVDRAWAAFLLGLAAEEEEDADEVTEAKQGLAALQEAISADERKTHEELVDLRARDQGWNEAVREADRAAYDRADTAPAVARAALSLAEARGAPEVDVAACLELLAGMEEGEPAAAHLERAIQLREGALGPTHGSLIEPLTRLAKLRESDAEPLLQRALSIAEQVHGPGVPDTANVAQLLGEHLATHDRSAEALEYLERGLASAEWTHRDYALVSATKALADAYDDLGQTDRAEELYRRCIERIESGDVDRRLMARQHASATWRLGRLLGDQDRDVEAGEQYARACEMDAWYCQELAFASALGEGVARDLGRATALFERSCDAGRVGSCDLAAGSYLQGQGVAPDPQRAAELLGRACDGERATACGTLARMYHTGDGVELDLERAATFYERGCELGDGASCSNLGVMYGLGEGVAADPVREASLYEKACATGLQDGCVNLGWLYEEGVGVAQDAGRARELYETACTEGNLRGCHGAGNLALASGDGPALERAASFYRSACEGGFAMSCTDWGLLHLDDGYAGLDRGAALDLLRRGCDGGNALGCQELALKLVAEDAGSEEALARAREALRLEPDGPDRARALGQVLTARGAFAEAEVQVRSAAERRGHASDWAALGDALQGLGRTDDALDSWRRALAAETQDLDDPAALRARIAQAEGPR